MSEETIFTAALGMASKAERAAYLAEACAGDAGLRLRVEALLASHEEAHFLRTSAAERAAIAFAGEAAAGMTGAAEGAETGSPLDFLAPSEKPGSLGSLGHYEVLEVIGRGGMGVVLRAFDGKLHRVVAIKVMARELAASAAARRRFAREARAAAAVSHDHIVTIHAVEEAGGLPYMVMQYVAGMSLQERLEGREPLRLHEILRIGMQTASGLSAAHAQGLIHRDIKPANILLEDGVERVKITDFGLARAVDDASLTQSGIVAGTPQYMAPEQARGEAVDQRADLFSLGSVLYAMCTGRAPFRAGGTMAVLKRVCEESPGPIREANPEIPEWLVAIIRNLHAKDPAERYQSAAEVAEVLARHLAHAQHHSAGPSAASDRRVSPMPTRRRRRWVAAVAGLAASLAGLGLAEATGVSRLTATMVRILTPDGTLVVEANDPDVRVTVEGDGGLRVTGAGAGELRLRPGSYQVRATKDGRPIRLDRDLVTITRNDVQVVRIRLEAGERAASDARVGRGAFVLLADEGSAARPFDTLVEAVRHASSGDTIEVRGQGPFVGNPVVIADRRAITIRAGAGSRPVLRLAPGGPETNASLIRTNGPLTLEGLEIHCEERPTNEPGRAAISADGGYLFVANCRFVVPSHHSLFVHVSRRAVVRNSEFLSSPGWSDALAGHHLAGSAWELDNCVQVGGALVSCGFGSPEARDSSVRIRRCTLIGCRPVIANFHATPKDLEPGRSPPPLTLDVSGCLTDTGPVLGLGLGEPASSDPGNPLRGIPGEDAVRTLVRWSGSSNVHRMPAAGPSLPADVMVHWGKEAATSPLPGIVDLNAWRAFWGSAEPNSLEGAVRYRGGDLAGRLATGDAGITPQDYLLRPDSAGYRAGPRGRDIGADVDLVGPGPAYERWKATPEYQAWLAETGRMR